MTRWCHGTLNAVVHTTQGEMLRHLLAGHWASGLYTGIGYAAQMVHCRMDRVGAERRRGYTVGAAVAAHAAAHWWQHSMAGTQFTAGTHFTYITSPSPTPCVGVGLPVPGTMCSSSPSPYPNNTESMCVRACFEFRSNSERTCNHPPCCVPSCHLPCAERHIP